jgi:hypothetical protein
MTIQEQRCPRCGIKRTVWLGEWGSFCFNCRLRSGDRHEVARPAAPPPPSPCLSPAGLARLATYRAAVRAGFYSDWPTRDTTSTGSRPAVAEDDWKVVRINASSAPAPVLHARPEEIDGQPR